MERQHLLMWRVYRSVVDMLQNRGYLCDTVISEKEFYDRITIHYTDVVQGVAQTFDKGLLNCSMTHSKTNGALFVMFMNEETIGRKHISELIERLNVSNIDHCVLIYGNALTSSARKDIDRQKVRIEAFSQSEMLYNVLNHAQMPKFTVLSKNEKLSIFGNNKSLIKESQLPRITSSDKSARYLGLRRGDVVRIERESQTSGVTVTYRICV